MKRSLDGLFASAQERPLLGSLAPRAETAESSRLRLRMRHAMERVVAWFTEY